VKNFRLSVAQATTLLPKFTDGRGAFEGSKAVHGCLCFVLNTAAFVSSSTDNVNQGEVNKWIQTTNLQHAVSQQEDRRR
jgi:hypothetical protein